MQRLQGWWPERVAVSDASTCERSGDAASVHGASAVGLQAHKHVGGRADSSPFPLLGLLSTGPQSNSQESVFVWCQRHPTLPPPCRLETASRQLRSANGAALPFLQSFGYHARCRTHIAEKETNLKSRHLQAPHATPIQTPT